MLGDLSLGSYGALYLPWHRLNTQRWTRGLLHPNCPLHYKLLVVSLIIGYSIHGT